MIPCTHFSWADYHVFTHPLPKLTLTVQAGTVWGWVFRSLGAPGGSRGHPWARCLSGAACAFWRGPRFSEYDPCSCANSQSGCCAPSPRHRQLTTQLRMEWGKRPPLHWPAGLGKMGHSLCLSCSHFSAPEKSWDEKVLLALSWAALGEGRCQKVKQFLLPAPRMQIWIFFFFFCSSNVLELLWWTTGHVQNLFHLRVIVYQVSSEAPGPTKKLEPVHQPVRVRAETEVCTPITLHRPVWDASQDPSSMVWTPELTEARVSMMVTKLLLIT